MGLRDDVVHVKEVEAADEGAAALGRQGKLFAVVRLQGKQHLVSEGDVIMTDRLAAPVGHEMALPEVLLVGAEDMTLVGRPLVDEGLARVSGVVEEHSRTEKVQVFKKKRRKGYR